MATDQRRIAALVDADARAAAKLARQMDRIAAQQLAGLSDRDFFYLPAEVNAVAGNLADRSAKAQQARADLSAGTTQRLLRELGDEVKAPPVDASSVRTGVEPVEVWLRPMKEYRYQLSRGKTPEQARAAALRRAELISDVNLQLADRMAAQQVMAASAKVIGHRRVIHPELSVGGTCGLCVAASTRFYYVEELRAVHERCHCTTVPILSGSDIGDDLNTYDIAKLYADNAGSTDGRELKLTRYQIDEHGELGPVLRRQGDNFRDAADVEHDLGRPKPAEPINLDAAVTRDEAVAQLQTLLRQSPQDKAAISAKKAEISRLNRRGA